MLCTTSLCEYYRNIGWVPGHLPMPLAKTAVLIYSLNPFGHKFPLRYVLLGVLPFRFKDQELACLEFDYEVRSILPDHSLEYIKYLKPKVVILNPCLNNSRQIGRAHV